MPDFQYQPPTGPLSGSEFERQTTQFFQQVSAAAGAASTAASAAQTTANEALERAQASNFVDGKTTRAEADGAITVKDVAIGGNLEDLASKRGQIGTPPIQIFTKTSADDAATLNLNDDKWWVNGEYSLYLRSEVFSFTPVVNNTPLEVSGNYSARLRVANVYHTGNGIQEFSIAIGGRTIRTYYRTRFFNSDNTLSYYPWREAILTSNLGDGIRVTNGIISVPEYEGATASAAGTSGLVPPAAAGQHESFLTGGGEYKPALTKISDSVSLEDSKTAASAKAVKTAYDRGTAGVTAANGKLSLSGGVMSGRIGGLRGNYNADASSRYVTGALEIRENGGVGNAQSDIAYAPTIGFHWANRVAGLLALRSDGIFTFLKQNGTRAVVDCDVPYATAANKLRREGGVDTSWYWSGQGGQPGWLWGGNDGVNMYVYNPANFSVNYANSCNYANGAEYANNAGSVVGTPNINVNNNGFNTLPPGGTWRLIQSDGSGFLQIKGEYAGGTYVGYSKFMYIRIA